MSTSPTSPRRVRPAALATLALASALVAAPAFADIVNGWKLLLSINGQSVLSASSVSPNSEATQSRTTNQSGVTATTAAGANQYTSGKVDVSGTGSAVAKIQANSTYMFNLKPPSAGTNVKGGKLILHVVVEGSAVGDSEVHVVTAVQADFGKGEGSAVISDGNTPRVEFDVTTPIAAFIDDIEKAGGSVHMHLDATARLNGGAPAVAEAKPTTRVTSFKVLNGAGAQVTGFTMIAAGGNVAEAAGGPVPPPATGTNVPAVEFYNASFKHYFISASSAEIGKLDDGTFPGWTRTGQTFNVSSGPATGLVAVCRFFTVAFPPTSSHFYAPRGLGCEGTLTNAQWQYEGEVFYVPVPNAADGACPPSTLPVYRLYNNGRGGAPNHRFTTSQAVRTQMLGEGFVAEGAGIGVGFCSPQ